MFCPSVCGISHTDLTHALFILVMEQGSFPGLLSSLLTACVCVCFPLRSAVCNVYRHGGDGRKQWRDLLQQIWLRFHQNQILP